MTRRKKTESADSTPLQEGLSIPDEIKRSEDRIAKLSEAKEESTGRKASGKAPRPPLKVRATRISTTSPILKAGS